MKTFTVELHDATHAEHFEDVVSFVAEDASGSFGLQGGHERCMTVLRIGLARFRTVQGRWQYVAMPGAVLNFDAGTLWVGTRRFLLGDDYSQISQRLEEELLVEERSLRETSHSLRRMEEELLRRLWQAGEEGL